jgi:hypothetical protein
MRCVSVRESRLPARRSLGKSSSWTGRLDGRDCEIEVGKPLPSRSVVVLDHGREQVFAVYTDGGDADVVRVGRHG